jgi:predicted component of type VI protein secretion system
VAQRLYQTHGRSAEEIQSTHQERISSAALAIFRKPSGDFRVDAWADCRA